MKITRHWLEDWLDLRTQDRILARQMTENGLEVETLDPLVPPFRGVCVAQILNVIPHPSLSHLSICDLTSGTEQAKVISGAPNVGSGVRVAWAKIGARLPDMAQIGARWFDGIGSQGMLCSDAELTLGSRADRILELPATLRLGEDLGHALGWPDVLYDINVTPNRGDCLSALGLAREIAAFKHVKLKRALSSWSRDLARGPSVVLSAHQACSNFATFCFEISNPHIETPLWIKVRLNHLGITPVHPVVDVTQYVMIELGQPTHAYDLDRLSGDSIEVRWAQANESCLLLNNREVKLDENILVISDARSVMGVAGIMGSKETAVRTESHRFMIESAHFAPSAIVGRARRLGLESEAAARFERGVDPQLPLIALERVCEMLIEIYGDGLRLLNSTQVGSSIAKRALISLPRSLCSSTLGLRIKSSTVEKKLCALGCGIQKTEDGLDVAPPSYRFDLTSPIDLVEEIARLIGYNKLPGRSLQGSIRLLPPSGLRLAAEKWNMQLVARGYQETIHMTFSDPVADQDFAWGSNQAIAIRNPLAQDQSILRRSLWPSLIGTLLYNQAREQKRVRIFEIGSVFDVSGEHFQEQTVAAGLWNGLLRDEQWGLNPRKVDFFDVKADLEMLLEPVLEELRFEPLDLPSLDPAESAGIFFEGRQFGVLGAVHPRLEKHWGIQGKTYLWSLNMIDLANIFNVEYKEATKYPAVRRDFAFILPKSVPVHEIRQALLETGQPLLREIKLFDLYIGSPLEEGQRSLAFGLLFRSQDSTLTEKVVSDLCARLISMVEGRFRGKLRQ